MFFSSYEFPVKSGTAKFGYSIEEGKRAEQQPIKKGLPRQPFLSFA
jgi:hypothetical protein